MSETPKDEMSNADQAASQGATFGEPAKDDSFELNLESANGTDQTSRIPRGRYKGKCLGFTKGTSKSSGNPMLTWQYTITEGKFAGREFPMYTVLTAAGAWKLKETLVALGLPTDGPLKATNADVMNKKVVLLVDDDTYMGVEKSKLLGTREAGFIG